MLKLAGYFGTLPLEKKVAKFRCILDVGSRVGAKNLETSVHIEFQFVFFFPCEARGRNGNRGVTESLERKKGAR